jgi:hypothetical protein
VHRGDAREEARKASNRKARGYAYTQSSILRIMETSSTHQSVSYLNAFPRCDLRPINARASLLSISGGIA